MFNFYTLNGPTPLPAPRADLMAAVVAALAASAAVTAAFGHTAATPKFLADEAATSPAPPYLVYTEADDVPLRVFGGNSVGQGSFEVQVVDATKAGCRAKLALVRAALNAMPVPQDVGEGTLVYLKNEDNRSEPFAAAAPAPPQAGPAPNPAPVCFGRAMTFRFQVSRTDP